MDLYQQNYRKLLQLLPGLHDMSGPAKLAALGHTDVHVDVIERPPSPPRTAHEPLSPAASWRGDT